VSFVAGQYTVTWSGSSLGQIANGIRVKHEFFKKMITGDNFAETPQDGIFRGGQMFASMTLLEYNATGAQLAFWPYSATIFTMGVIGRLDVGAALAKSLVLTAIAGTSAAAAPATQTHLTSILREGFPVELLYAPDLREVPLEMRIYPNSSGVFGTQT
jgi:hypothetical protein